MRVLFVTQYGRLAASSRTRVFQYLPYLAENQIQTRVLTVLPDRAIAWSNALVTRTPWRKVAYYAWASYRTLLCGLRAWWMATGCDVLFVQKVIFPAPVRWLLRRRRPPLAFDFDDAIFTTEVRQKSRMAAWKERRNARGLPAMLSLADLVIVENQYTAGYAQQFCRQVATITGPIDTHRFRPAEGGSRHADRVVLGWIGSPSTLPYIALLATALQRLSRRYPQVRLRVVGADRFALDGVDVQATAWDLEREVEDLQGFDVGLTPIPDDPWTRGKGGYKLLQYMATGLPVVTSPVGINQELVEDGKEGFWASSAQEWEQRLAALVESPELRRRMGQRGRAKVGAEYALDASSVRLVGLLRQLATRTGTHEAP
ncbi:MAG: glycosyltransferase family 4 protein [Candidatus Latescibacterota bacterium]